MLLIVDTEDTESPELLVAPHCNHEAVEGAHRSEEDQSDEPRADGDQLLRTPQLRRSVQQHCWQGQCVIITFMYISDF